MLWAHSLLAKVPVSTEDPWKHKVQQLLSFAKLQVQTLSFVLGPSTLRQPGNQGDISTDIDGPWLPDAALNLNWSLCAHDPSFQPPARPWEASPLLKRSRCHVILGHGHLVSQTPAFRSHNASGTPGAVLVWFLGIFFIIEDHRLLGPIPKEYWILKSVSLRQPPAQLTSTKPFSLSDQWLQNTPCMPALRSGVLKSKAARPVMTERRSTQRD